MGCLKKSTLESDRKSDDEEEEESPDDDWFWRRRKIETAPRGEKVDWLCIWYASFTLGLQFDVDDLLRGAHLLLLHFPPEQPLCCWMIGISELWEDSESRSVPLQLGGRSWISFPSSLACSLRLSGELVRLVPISSCRSPPRRPRW